MWKNIAQRKVRILRIDPALDKRITRLAAADDRSFNTYVERVLKRHADGVDANRKKQKTKA